MCFNTDFDIICCLPSSILGDLQTFSTVPISFLSIIFFLQTVLRLCRSMSVLVQLLHDPEMKIAPALRVIINDIPGKLHSTLLYLL